MPVPGYQEQLTRIKSGDPLLKIDVYYVPEQKVISMDLETYVKGVVASEMPASFHPEALKAMAVAARTYAVRKMRIFGGSPSRPDADVTSDPKIDQAWAPVEVLRQRWGPILFLINWARIEKACEETRGLILMYGGLPAEAVYHSTCGGQTEAARDVWGRDVPYLQSVTCTFCQHSPYSKYQQVVVSKSTLSDKLSASGISVPVWAMTDSSFMSVTRVSPTGRIKELSIWGQSIKGTDFRNLLGLRSTLLTWSIKGDSVVFQVKGYGHGVGMCQYGADGMGRQGKSFKEILAFYYPGTRLAGIFEE